MAWAIVAVQAIHVANGQVAGHGCLGVAAHEGGNMAARVPVLDPRNGLALVIGVSITNVNARTQVRAMNPLRAPASSYMQQQDGLGGRVGFLRAKLGDHAELVSE